MFRCCTHGVGNCREVGGGVRERQKINGLDNEWNDYNLRLMHTLHTLMHGCLSAEN